MSTTACTSLPAWFDLSADRCQPCQPAPPGNFPHREYSMAEVKKLSRSVKGLTVLVTGAASGMGRATAHAFADEGANVAVTDLSAEGTRAVADAVNASGGKAKAWTLDVADPKAIVSVINDIAAHFGSLDIIINNAGLSLRAAIDA